MGRIQGAHRFLRPQASVFAATCAGRQGLAAIKPFRSDWASWIVADLLQLEWRGRETRYNVLSPDYRWQAPKLPVAISAYTE